MVSRVLAYFFQFAFVAILIVFQPEIRKALEQVGRNNVGQSIAAVVTGRDRSYDRAQIRKAINAVVRRRGHFTAAQNGRAYRIRAQNEAWRHH